MRRHGRGVLVALALVLSACTTAPHAAPARTIDGAASTPSSPTPSSSTPPPAQRSPRLIDFGPHAVSFVSATDGWALAQQGCFGCMALFRTHDAGEHWREISRPRLRGAGADAVGSASIDLLFVDRRNGYLVTDSRCRANCAAVTSDGGRSWHSVALPPISELTSAGRFVYALNAHSLFVTAPGERGWRREPLPTEGKDVTMSAGDAGRVALLRVGKIVTGKSAAELGRLRVSTDAGRHWSSRPVPCTERDGGAALVSVAAHDRDDLLVDCFDGLESSQAQRTRHHVYTSTDGGHSWRRLTNPIHTGDPALLVDTGTGRAFLAVQGGLRNVLAATGDGGRTWRNVISIRPGFFGWADLHFVDARTGFVLGPTHNAHEHLYRTTDGGQTWRRLPLPPRR